MFMILTFEDSTVDATVIPLVSLCLTGLVSPSLAQPQPPCDQITASCREAGFLPGSVNGGVDLTEDCIRPMMQGTAQRKQATKALPQIDPRVVAACKAEGGPVFGEESRRDLAQELSVEDRACITAAAAKLPRVAALKIGQSRVVPQPSAQKERNNRLH